MKDFSNYHGVNTNEKLTHDGLLLLEKSLDGFSAYDVIIDDDKQTRLLIYRKWDANSQTRKVIGKREDIEIGNILEFEAHKWLVTTFPEDNKIYKKAEIKLCNSTFHIQSDKTRVLIGHDGDGRPIYEEQYAIDYHEPCVVENKVVSTQDSGQILLPEGQLNITMKYIEADNVKLGSEFRMYEETYEIRDIDYSKVINGIGIVTLNGRRRTGAI